MAEGAVRPLSGEALSGQTAAKTGKPVLEIENLSVQFRSSHGLVRAVENVGYSVHPGEMVAIVGESGSGKSVSALTIMRLLAQTAEITSGTIVFDGRDLLKLSDEEMRRIRGHHVSMIFQEPMTSLNPVLRIGLQIMEPLFIHLKMTPDEAKARAVELLTLVGITDPESRLEQYPHQLSGGMRQRVMIAIGLACNPKLLIADEPTNLSRRLGIAVIIITHNLGIVARYADRVNVMYAARIVESGTAEEVFGNARHPYARGLLSAVPRLDRGRAMRLQTIEGAPPNLLKPPAGCRFRPRCRFAIDKCEINPPLVEIEKGHRAACHRSNELEKIDRPTASSHEAISAVASSTSGPILQLQDVTKFFPIGGGLFQPKKLVRAVNKVTLDIAPGETLGLVGESGCGKSTLGRVVLRLDDPTDGKILFEGADLAKASSDEMLAVRKKMQVIFQDPFSSLNPRMTVGEIIAEPMRVHQILPKDKIHDRVAELLSLVGLHGYMADRYPHQLSGGQRQRVGIARALSVNPKFIVCDEAVSALDVSIQGQVINLLESLQLKLGLSYLFIAHDLAVVRHISHKDELFANPKHPYTQALLAAAPIPDPVIERTRPRRIITGELPSPLRPPPGCVFNPRCPIAVENCRKEIPALRELGPKHWVACSEV